MGGIFAALLCAAPANAQATRTWVSGVGDDANPCSRTAPCKTFAGAISKTAANGEINCLDPAGYGAVTITKSIAIVCEFTEGGLVSSGTNGIIVNTGVNDVVTLSGLELEGLGTSLNGIHFIGGGVLHVKKTTIRGYRSGGSGINFVPNNGAAELHVSDVVITDSGNSTTTGGINIRPTGTATARVSINRAQVENCSSGIIISPGGTGNIGVGIFNTVVSGSTNTGISSSSTTALQQVMVVGSMIAGNTTGISSDGSQSKVGVSTTTVTTNGTGLSFSNGALLFTYHTNNVNANFAADGAFSLFVPQQ
jgi:hypothetical protein